MLAILADPSAPGRDYVLHTSDEQFVEAAHQEAPLSHRDVPPHVIAYRRKVDNVNAKFGLYAFWGEQDPSVIKADGQETECYDYSTHLGRLETQNVSQSAATLCSQLHDDLVQNAIPNELRRPLPARLHGAQSRAWDRYRAYARQHHFR
jgi:hypothetical protein